MFFYTLCAAVSSRFLAGKLDFLPAGHQDLFSSPTASFDARFPLWFSCSEVFRRKFIMT